MDKVLGLKRGTVELHPYNPRWIDLFVAEKALVKRLLGYDYVDAEHIGSTAIPGLSAKPVLDWMLAVRCLEDWEHIEETLKQAGYQFRSDERDNLDHVFFVKGQESDRTHYLKVTERGSKYWSDQICFRDMLVQNSALRSEYQLLKEAMLESFGDDRKPYTKGKKEFVRKVLALAANF